MAERLSANMVYPVGLGMAESRPGVYIGLNRNGNHKILVRSTEKDRGIVGTPRVYSFKQYTLEGFEKKTLRVHKPNLVGDIRKEELGILTHLLESRGL